MAKEWETSEITKLHQESKERRGIRSGDRIKRKRNGWKDQVGIDGVGEKGEADREW